MTAAHRARVLGPLSVIAVTVLLSGCTTRLSELARGRTFMQGLAAGGVVEEGDVAVLPANAEVKEDDEVTPIETVPGETFVTGPDGSYVESEAVQTGFIDLEGGLFPEAPQPQMGETTAYLGRGPAVKGQRLDLKPGQTATGKALELQDELKESKSREDELEMRVAELESEIKRKDQRIVQAVREMNATRKELIAVRGQLEDWSRNMNELRARIKSAEADNLATMQTIIALLQQFLQVESDMQIQEAAPLNLEDLLPGQGQGQP